MENKKGPELYVMELSRGQLILLICVSLFLALTFFGAGVLVGRIDPPRNEHAASRLASEEIPTETYALPVTAMGAKEGETAPAATGQPATPRSETTARRTAESPPRSPFMENRPRLTELPPLPASRQPAPAAAPMVVRPEGEEGESTLAAAPAVTAQPAALNTPVSPASVPAAPTTPAPPSPSTAAVEPLSPLLAPLEPITPPAASTPPATVAAPATPAPPSTPAVSAPAPGKFGVQLGAFSGSDRKNRAESFQRQLWERHGLRAEILPSLDQKNYRVVIIGFADRNAAEATCRDIRLKPELSGAFVRAL